MGGVDQSARSRTSSPGLACEDSIESRLIVQGRKGWKVEHGPFAEARFGKLGKHPWTLLVQAVDHVVPDVAALIAPFRFVPDWRIDDVMVSYASDGGGVGPHFDQYDVFLVQGLGRRRWQVGGLCDEATALLPNQDLRLLADFAATDEWVLEPGDILYVPPRFAHNGIAEGDDCMTYSIGFRAPSRSELIGHWSDQVLEGLGEDDRYGDPDLSAQANPGEISAAALDTPASDDRREGDGPRGVRAVVRRRTTASRRIRSSTGSRRCRSDLRTCARRWPRACRWSATRRAAFSFVRRDAGAVLLFVDGECFECEAETAGFAEALCAGGEAMPATDAAVALVVALVNQGSLAFGRGGMRTRASICAPQGQLQVRGRRPAPPPSRRGSRCFPTAATVACSST